MGQFNLKGGRTMAKTQPEPVRDPKTDHLLTPQNCVMALIDYQPEQYSTVTSSPHEEITLNAVALCKFATSYEIPVVLSTVGVDIGVNEGTIAAIREALPGVEEIDRTGVNSWEDEDFRRAIESTGRRKVVIAGLWTEVCLSFPTLDMLAERYEVYPVADAVGGISRVSHERAFDRMIQAGAKPITAIAFGSELMRNWAREDSDKLRQVMRWYFPQHRTIPAGS
jgi:nicotinamidase-related amidase